MMTLHALAAVMGVEPAGIDVELKGVSLDSRQVKPGFLYLAMQGVVADGHNFIQAAIANGATALICENTIDFNQAGLPGWVDTQLKNNVSSIASDVYGNASEQLDVVGITGTNGKTSISYYLLQLIRALGDSCGQIGTLGLQLEDAVTSTHNTTPDACTLQKFFHDAVAVQTHHVAMEVSSHALDQGRVENIAFTTAIFTNLTHDHLDYHASMDEYFEAKLALFKVPSIKVAIVNVDDEYGKLLTRLLAAHECKLITYSLDNSWADVYAKNIHTCEQGINFDICYQSKTLSVQTQLIGRFNVANILAVTATLLANNFTLEKIVQCLPLVKPVKGRMEVVANNCSVLALVDYAHTPDALRNVLQASQTYVENQRKTNAQAKLITVFGCGGDRDKAKRALMAEVAETLSDVSIVTSDNPRSESQSDIVKDIIKGFSGTDYIRIDDRAKAVEHAVSIASAGDTLLLAGKGHENYQDILGERHFFSDVQCLAKAFDARCQHV